jgi:hypothetical protein
MDISLRLDDHEALFFSTKECNGGLPFMKAELWSVALADDRARNAERGDANFHKICDNP